jgi:hypothetical protein
MSIPSNGDAAWLRTQSAAPPPGAAPEEWEATRAQSMMATQIMRDVNESEPGESRDIGRLVGDNQRELFVSCGPVEAMRQQFEILDPAFIAVHDVGTALSRKLLAGIAVASGRRLQKLVIRRQGYGTPLATLEFIEWPTAQGTILRLYTTEIDADTAARTALAITLLAYSRLGVVMVGDLPAHALNAAFYPLQQGLLHGPWPNRHLLMLPLSSASAVASQSAQLVSHTGVTVRTTPHISRPAEAWGFISGTWNHMHDEETTRGLQLPGISDAAVKSRPAAPPAIQADSAATAATPAAAPVRPPDLKTASTPPLEAPAAAPAPAQPLPLRPMPAVPGPEAAPARLEDMLADYVGRLIKLNGMLSCTVFETATSRTLAHAGTKYTANALAQQGRALIDAVLQCGQALGMPVGAPELALSLDAHHLVLRPLPRHAELMLHAVFDKNIANLTLVRLQIQRFDEDFTS